MKRISIRRAVPLTIAVVLSVIVSSVVAVSARGETPFDQVLAKLDEIIEALTPPPANAQVTVATSPVLMSGNQEVTCLVANLGTESVEGPLRVINESGIMVEGTVVAVSPGHTVGAEASGSAALRCDFTFEGAATLVRGSLQVRNIADGTIAAIAEMR